jgi:hypothetical protein
LISGFCSSSCSLSTQTIDTATTTQQLFAYWPSVACNCTIIVCTLTSYNFLL